MIKSIDTVIPQIYCYTTPGVTYHDGWCKIGYTEQKVEKRIAQQGHDAGIVKNEEWRDLALYADGSGLTFTDDDFRQYLISKGVNCNNPWDVGDEWYEISPEKAHQYFNEFRMKPDIVKSIKTYHLRKEQIAAVNQAKELVKENGGEMLLNAKPRFGKSLSVLTFCQEINAEKVLILTNRPAVANSWYDDYEKHLGRESGYFFVSSVDDLKGRSLVKTYEQYEADKRSRLARPDAHKLIMPKLINFVSLQDLKGSIYFGGVYNKLKEVGDIHWDVLVIDESHEGVETYKTNTALDRIHRNFTLYLSGTPFKALRDGKFDSEDIYNWTYVDEAIAKDVWNGDGKNPYLELPTLNMHTYRLSNIIGAASPDLSDDDTYEYTHRLNEFFATSNGKFIHNTDVDKFLDALVYDDKFPFSSIEKREELKHTFWLMFRVDDAKAMAKKLKEHPVFSEYEIVLAAGDGKISEDEPNVKSFQKVTEAIKTHDKTITLSVQQLTTGVTIPEWTAVLMLSERNSPAQYMQAAFRAQNPWFYFEDGKYHRKENAYVFDFNPEHTLTIVEQFANDLCSETAGGRGDVNKREDNIEKLLKYLPVMGENEEGEMVKLDAQQVLSIPRRIRCEEVVRRGFMSNMLFQNIANVFRAPIEVIDMIKQFPAVSKPDTGVNVDENTVKDLHIDDNGNVNIPKQDIKKKADKVIDDGKKQDIIKAISDAVDTLPPKQPNPQTERDKIAKAFADQTQTLVIDSIREADIPMSKATENTVKREIAKQARDTANKLHSTHQIDVNTEEQKIKAKYESSPTPVSKDVIEKEISTMKEKKQEEFKEALKKEMDSFVEICKQASVEIAETTQLEGEKEKKEDEIKNHLKGFSRTIPSFLMAYGDERITLQNFDTIIPEDVFLEVTGITIEQFKFLRDGGEYEDKVTGETKTFAGNLFEPTVFNDSIKRFLAKKQELANYFNEEQKGDIFDYIPPQRTNLIYTPKTVVANMVSILEENNKGCFDDPEHTFIDMYMKSGLYIAEIVKRLYRSPKMQELYPDSFTRLKHIFEKQVYGLAPTKIIYEIAKNFILGFDTNLEIEHHNLKYFDATEDAQNGTLEAKLQELFFSDENSYEEKVEEIIEETVIEDIANDVSENPFDYDDITDYFDIKNIVYIDNRDKGGALWLIGGSELAELVENCKKFNVFFKYKPTGSKATRGKRGWWAR